MTTVLLLALMAGCLDVAAPGGVRRAQLALYPVYDVADVQDGTASDVDSFVVLVRNPPFPDTTISVRIPAGQDTVQVDFTVTVTAGEDTVAVTFDGYSSVTGQKLYSGSTTITLVGGTPRPPEPVAVSYVGPGQAVGSLSVEPRAAGLQSGNQVQLTYSALDTLGAAMPDDSVPVTFISRNTAVAIVTAAGLVQAAGNGDAYVVVRSVARSSVRDSAHITVAAVPQALIGLSPTSVAIADTVGTSSPATVNVSVTNAGGGSLTGLAVGAITYGSGASGWLTATLTATTAPTSLALVVDNTGLAAGTYTATVPVTASGVGNSPQNLTVTLNMTAQQLASIAITPGFVAARPGDNVALTVTGKNASGGTAPTGALTFTSRATGVATVNSSGQVTAVAAGTAVIVAQATANTAIADSIVVAVAGNGTATVSAVSNSRAFDLLRVGDTVRVRVAVDLRGVSPEKLGSYNAQLDWSAARLTFVSAETVTGGFGGTIINTTATGTGQLRFGAADPAGHAGPTVALLDIKLVATSAGSSPLTLTLTDLSAAETFIDLLPAALIVSGVVRVQ
ncbi:MAG: hypothetical protein A2085_05795 [Gemmatimonadetes bacterium GWC2_71_10]|nr:MAG: hypothetical protein A2085_05795 [Gemmatimonadetes bacterium GWC2_71_10]